MTSTAVAAECGRRDVIGVGQSQGWKYLISSHYAQGILISVAQAAVQFVLEQGIDIEVHSEVRIQVRFY